MSHTLAMVSQKGGTGKTTNTHNIGAILAKIGARVLLVDIDHQGDLSASLGIEPDDEASMYTVLKDNATINRIIVETAAGVDLIPATLKLAIAEVELSGAWSRERLLENALARVKDRYDYIIIDCPPSLGLYTINAMTAADAVIVSLQLQARAYRALDQVDEIMALVKGSLNKTLQLGGVICTQRDNTSLSKTVENLTRERYGDTVFKTVISRRVVLAESPGAAQSIIEYAPDSESAQEYRQLTQELQTRYASK